MSTSRVVVLAAIDGTKDGLEVARYAADFANRTPGVELHLAHCVTQLRHDVSLSEIAAHSNEATFVREGDEALQSAHAECTERFAGPVTTHLTAGTPVREVLQLANDIQASLVIVGTHDLRGPKRLLLGSVSEQIAKKAQCPVLVVRPVGYVAAELEIEPPCPDCVATQTATNGAQLWCERHSHSHRRIHTVHRARPVNIGNGSMFIRT